MTQTWIPWCIKRPGPDWKGGYAGVPKLGTLAEKEGEVKHSAEGSLAALFSELDRSDRIASWHFSLAKDGTVYQHYPLEWRCWHCGVKGDRKRDTSLIGNLTLIGEEHEGGGPNAPGEPLTSAQLVSTIRLSQDVRDLCGITADAALRVNMWEHNWLSQTSCPSGRIPWTIILEEVDMDAARVEEIVRAMTFTPPGHTGATLAQWIASYHRHRGHPNVAALKALLIGNRSYRRRVMELVARAIGAGYEYSPVRAKAQLDTVISWAKDLKKKIDSKQSVP